MFKNLKESFIGLVTTRMFFLMVVLTLLSGLLIYRIFVLQIVNGEEYLNNFKLRIRRETSIASTRGKIFDRNGVLIAYNDLAYNVTIEDVYESGSSKNANLNATLSKVINMVEGNGDQIISDFNVIIDTDGNYSYSVSGTQLLRFLADIYGHAQIQDLSYSEQTATPDELMNHLMTQYGVGSYTIPGDRKTFVPGEGYTKEQALEIITIRNAMSANTFQKYITTTIAADVCDETVAVIMENSSDLDGISIEEDTIRKYNQSYYFSNILGYTGRISQEEYDELSTENEGYTLNDMIGKAGIEQTMETVLQGTKGSETIYVDNLGKIIETTDRTEPIAGNDLYLTIDSELQEAVYRILEQKIAGILVDKIENVKDYTPSPNASASSIIIPIDDVYYALFNNSIIDISRLSSPYAGEYETRVYNAYNNKIASVLDSVRQELESGTTPYSALSEEMQSYQSYIITMLQSSDRNVLVRDNIDTTDATYIAWTTDESISIKEYLEYAIAQNWVDITKLSLESKYSDSSEIYQQLVNYIIGNLGQNTEFSKRIYKYMIADNNITGTDICMVLWEQDNVNITEKEINRLISGEITAYSFMLNRISQLDITPAQLALDPCSGSVVITDVGTGEVLALVSYPGYDINRLANSIDSAYYSKLTTDLSNPLYNYATQERTAPGSTFKMVSAVAGLMDGVVSLTDTIQCTGTFDKLNQVHRCWINPGAHGNLNITGAIENSCNVYFYELGYRLATQNGQYDDTFGVDRLEYYADQFGLSETTGIEIAENEPRVSDEYPVLSAIGQGTNNYTTVGLARYVNTVANSGTCYNLSLVDYLTDPYGKLIEDYTPEVRNTIELDSSIWNAVQEGMRRVVANKTSYNDFGVTVAGKTGTAQQTRTRPNHALFVSYAPYENPEIAVATRVAYGYSSDYAAQITKDVYSYYFELAEKDEIITGNADLPEAISGNGD